MDPRQKGKYLVTEAGAQKLEAELKELENKRTQVAENIRTAKAFGDLSENFEYQEAKREQGFVEGRILQVKAILGSLEVVPPEEVSTEEVGFGAQVTVREEDGEEWDLTIVGPLEADPMADRISYEAPLGSALMGRKVGEVVEANVPAGVIRYEIVKIQAYEE